MNIAVCGCVCGFVFQDVHEVVIKKLYHHKDSNLFYKCATECKQKGAYLNRLTNVKNIQIVRQSCLNVI